VKRRKRHIEHYNMCRAEEKADAKEPSSSSLTAGENTLHMTNALIGEQETGHPFVVVDSDYPSAKFFKALISITGMTCSSCVGKITEALKAKPWLHSVDVSLLTNSASVRFEGEEHTKELANIINSVGYKATIE
jgi:copper chaperone CopZ